MVSMLLRQEGYSMDGSPYYGGASDYTGSHFHSTGGELVISDANRLGAGRG